MNQTPKQPVSMPTPGADAPASGEEQAQFDQFIAFAELSIHNEDSQPMALKVIKDAAGVAEGVGRLIALLAMQYENQTGTVLSESVRSEALEDLLEEVFELAIAAGLMSENDYNTQAVELAAETAVKNYTEHELRAGRLDENSLKQRVQGMANTDEGQAVLNELSPEQQQQLMA